MKDRQKFTRFLRMHIEVCLIISYCIDVLIAIIWGRMSFYYFRGNYFLAIISAVIIGALLIYVSKLVVSRIGMAVEISENLHDLVLIAQKLHPNIIEDDIRRLSR